MFMKKTAVAAAFCLAMGAGGVANADIVLFNPAGTGAAGALTITAFDEIPGNSLAVSGAGCTPTPCTGTLGTVGSIVQTFYQASLGVLLNGSTGVFTNGDGGHFFTAVAGFYEQVTSVSGIPTATTSTFDNTAATQGLPSFFRICAGSALANDLTGGGFACDAAHAIITGTLSDIIGSSATSNLTSNVLLDQFSGDDWSNQRTVTSNGSANILVTITSVNANYFPSLAPGATITTSLTNTSFIDPYNEQNPSYCFTSNGTTSSTSGTTTCNNGSFQAFGTLGAVNGLSGPNFIFQSDANTQFQVTRVPEPGSLALLGLALGGMALVVRARKIGA